MLEFLEGRLQAWCKIGKIAGIFVLKSFVRL